MAESENIDSKIARLQEDFANQKQKLDILIDEFTELAEDRLFKVEIPEGTPREDVLAIETEQERKKNEMNIKRGDVFEQYKKVQALHQEVDELKAQKDLEDAIKNVKEKEGASKKADDALKKISPSYKRKRVAKWIVLALCGLAILGSPLVPGLLGATTGLLASSLSMLSTGALSVVGIFALYKFQEVQDKNKKEGMLMGFWNWLTNKEGPYNDAVKGAEKSKKDVVQAQKEKEKKQKAFEESLIVQNRTNPEDLFIRGVNEINGLFPKGHEDDEDFGAREYWNGYYTNLLQKLAINNRLTKLSYNDLINEAIANQNKAVPERVKDFREPKFWWIPERRTEREAERREERTA